jgi:hypothetical protein
VTSRIELRRRSLALAIALSLAGACGSATGPVRDGPLVVTAGTGVVVIHNVGREPLYTFALTREVAPLVDWAACTDPTHCKGIAAGERREIPYSEIYGYTPATREILVYAWNLVQSESGFKVGTMRVVILKV